MVLNNRAAAVMFALSAALVQAGVAAEVLDGVRNIAAVESRDELGQAADLCGQLAVMFDGSDQAVSQAATRAYFVLSDQSGRASTLCGACSFSLHLTHVHSVQATLGQDPGAETGLLCSCTCQRGRS